MVHKSLGFSVEYIIRTGLAFLTAKIFWFFGPVFDGKFRLAKHRNGFFLALNVGRSGVDTLGNYPNLVSNESLGVKIPLQKGHKLSYRALALRQCEQRNCGLGVVYVRVEVGFGRSS